MSHLKQIANQESARTDDQSNCVSLLRVGRSMFTQRFTGFLSKRAWMSLHLTFSMGTGSDIYAMRTQCQPLERQKVRVKRHDFRARGFAGQTDRAQCFAACTKSRSVVSRVSSWRMQSCTSRASMVPS